MNLNDLNFRFDTVFTVKECRLLCINLLFYISFIFFRSIHLCFLRIHEIVTQSIFIFKLLSSHINLFFFFFNFSFTIYFFNHEMLCPYMISLELDHTVSTRFVFLFVRVELFLLFFLESCLKSELADDWALFFGRN